MHCSDTNCSTPTNPAKNNIAEIPVNHPKAFSFDSAEPTNAVFSDSENPLVFPDNHI